MRSHAMGAVEMLRVALHWQSRSKRGGASEMRGDALALHSSPVQRKSDAMQWEASEGYAWE